ncbi:MAG TPA: alpha/beta fold hydrolase [Terriglobales bacterium]|nr:alpha/beta fold hydrolase [Terriglobales bacterium]
MPLEVESVVIPPWGLRGDLVVPDGAAAVVVFAHGTGSSRHSPRNRYVAGVLQQAGMATLLLDLLTAREDEEDSSTGEYRFDIELLAERLQRTADWLRQHPVVGQLPMAYFGASTGAGAALVAAARQPGRVAAIVSRGGRPDLAGPDLAQVHAPTLLIVGEDDTEVIRLNRAALAQLPGPKRLTLVPGATHLFEEPGTLEQAAQLARDWLLAHHLGRQRAA